MHWRAPTTMLTTFVVGIAFAIGHHFFYQSLNGTPVDEALFGQQINIGVGTAFAFLVNSFLKVAIGVAFVQVLWRNLLNERITISRIDSMSQLLTSFVDLLNVKTLWEFKTLAVLAIISWTLPIAGVVPPATLSVMSQNDSHMAYSIQNLPYIDFTKSNFTKTYSANTPRNILGPVGSPNQAEQHFFGGSEDALTQLAFGTAFQAGVSAIEAPAVNSSFSLQFWGPSIQCEPTPATIMNDFNAVFGCNFTNSQGNNRCQFAYTYLSWVPGPIDRVPLKANNGTGTINFNPRYDGSGYGLTTIGAFRSEPTMMYIATTSQGPLVNQTWSVLNCTLYNASYTVMFNYQNGIQKLSTSRKIGNSLSFINLVDTKMLADLPNLPPKGTVTPNADPIAVSYQAVMDSFGKIVVGGMYYAVTINGGGNNIVATSIMSTSLKDSAEISYNNLSTPIARAAEQLFENITLSLFSKSVYVTADASRFPPTNVTLFTYPNIYIYTWWKLVLAYGIAVLFSAICVLVGGITLLASGEGYNYTFSTIIRTTRLKAIDAIVMPEDTVGQDPLPKHIGKAHIMVGRQQNDPNDETHDDTQHNSHQQMQEAQPVNGDTDSRMTGDETRPQPTLRRRSFDLDTVSSISDMSRDGDNRT